MRLKAAVMLLKLRGAYPQNRQTRQHQPQQDVNQPQAMDVIMKAMKHQFND